MAVAEAEPKTKGSTNGSKNGSGKRPTSREEAAELIARALTDEPKSEAQIRRDLGFPGRTSSGRDDIFKNGFAVLESQHRARRIPASEGRRSGWVAYSADLEAPEIPGEQINFPYDWSVLSVDDMFIDADYQRPLTSFVDKIRKDFNPLLFNVLVVNQRDEPNKNGKRIAVIDGQTRWRAATGRGIKEVPCILFKGLTAEQEAEIFALLQTQRKGVMSLVRFRAQVKAKNEESLAIVKIAKAAGWKIGAGDGELRAVAALEWCYRRSPEQLDATLSILAESWPEDAVPQDAHIRGLHYFLSNFPMDERVKKEPDEDRLLTKLQTAGPGGLERKMVDAKNYHGKRSKAILMAYAIQMAYGKSK